jgi:hypothetical protein
MSDGVTARLIAMEQHNIALKIQHGNTRRKYPALNPQGIASNSIACIIILRIMSVLYAKNENFSVVKQ